MVFDQSYSPQMINMNAIVNVVVAEGDKSR